VCVYTVLVLDAGCAETVKHVKTLNGHLITKLTSWCVTAFRFAFLRVYLAVSTGGYHTCAISKKDDASTSMIKCWGLVDDGQIGWVDDTNVLLGAAFKSSLSKVGYLAIMSRASARAHTQNSLSLSLSLTQSLSYTQTSPSTLDIFVFLILRMFTIADMYHFDLAVLVHCPCWYCFCLSLWCSGYFFLFHFELFHPWFTCNGQEVCGSSAVLTWKLQGCLCSMFGFATSC
jgi:hypothetical protein